MSKFQEVEKKFLVKKDLLPDLSKRKPTIMDQFYIPIELFEVNKEKSFLCCNSMLIIDLMSDELKALLKAFNSLTEARVRVTVDGAKLTLKSKAKRGVRKEFEWKVTEAKHLTRLLINATKHLKKERHVICTSNGNVFEVDKFDNHSFILAELEVDSKKELENLCLPEWIGEDVTDNENYYNEKLAKLL